VLIECGADIDKAKTTGQTPLFMAAQNGLLEIVTMLIE
jgi:ankyrin repeat protein